MPCIQQVDSEIEIIKYIKLVSESHETSTNDIVLVAEVLPNYSGEDTVKDTILIALAEGEHVLPVRYVPEHQTSLVDALTQMKRSALEGYLNTFTDKRFSVSFEGVDSEEFFMPYYSITIEPDKTGFSIDEIKEKVDSHFDVLKTRNENGKIVFWCYAGEGPFVYTMRDILWVVMELFGPAVTNSFQTLGISDYHMNFHVSEWIC